jgi:hypothetical protein
MHKLTLVLFALAALLAALPASAQQNKSEYTRVATKGCEKIATVKTGGDEISATHACRGLRRGQRGYWVVIDESDLRTTVVITLDNLNADEERSQSFGPFNSVGEVMEWRIDGKTGHPIATILRWHIADNEDLDRNDRPKTVSLLVVTRIPPGLSCHVAYIDVRANENPNALAQKAADELAPNFDCTKDKVQVIGNRGRAAELSGAR